MAKKTSTFICQQCNSSFSRWAGKCEQCGEWNSIIEQLPVATGKQVTGKALQTTLLPKVTSQEKRKRLDTGFLELNDVLGGGLVHGSVVLIAGQPGIGKSTVLLQIAQFISRDKNVLYVSGEESLTQLKLRAERLHKKSNEIDVAASTSANDIAQTITSGGYDLVIVDSIQTMTLDEISSSAGTVSQITNSSNVLSAAAKSSGTALLLVGHVTKDGTIAGPKVLEHLVDVVLQFEGDRYGGFKVLRSVKNRFGSTNEAAIFEMKETGLHIVQNPSASLLEERQVSDGSVVLATMEGSQPLLVEIQALVTQSNFGYPKRASSGFDTNRLNLLVAMLTKRTKLQLDDKDIHINVVGGIKLTDSGSDLAICMAIASAAKGMQLKDDAVVFGEVGLSGEVRQVKQVEMRIKEAQKLGFAYAIGPRQKSAQPFVKSITTIRDGLNSFLSKKA